MTPGRPPLVGIYRHYKGPLYLVLGLAHDANADILTIANDPNHWDEDNFRCLPLGERAVVVYVPLQLDGAHLGARMAVRTLDDFLAVVHTDDGTLCGGKRCARPACDVAGRFTYLGPELSADML